MLNTTPQMLQFQHYRTATMLYGPNFLNNKVYLNSQYKQMFDLQYDKLLTFFN
jgi:hypothetical protein